MIKFLQMLPDEIKKQYSASTRLALRINALLMKNIGISIAIAELIAEFQSLEKLLLDKRIQNLGTKLNKDNFSEILKDYNVDEEFSDLDIGLFQNQDGFQIICLTDEVILENTGNKTSSEKSVKNEDSDNDMKFVLSKKNKGDVLKDLVSSKEVDQVFNPQAVAELKVLILTSTDAPEKIQAIRKLMLLNIDPETKGGILLQALQDEAPKVRSEAAFSLQNLGLSETITDSIIKISNGTKTEQLLVLQSLAEHSMQLRISEQGVLLAVLLGTLRSCSDINLLKTIINALLALTPILHLHPEPVIELDRHLSSLLLSYQKELNTDIYKVYEKMAQIELPGLKKLLIDRFNNMPMKSNPRNFYLSMIAEFFNNDEEFFDENISELVDIASNANELDPSTGRISSALRLYGEKAVLHIVKSLSQAKESSKSSLLIVLNRFSHEISLSNEIINKIAECFIEIYPSSRPPIRLSILESPFAVSPSMSFENANKIAKAVIEDLHEHKLERNLNILMIVLRKLGTRIMATLVNTVENGKYISSRLNTAKVIGLIGESYGEKINQQLLDLEQMEKGNIEKTLAEFMTKKDSEMLIYSSKSIRQFLDDDNFPDKSPLFTTLGKLIFSSAPDKKFTVELCEYLLDNLRTSYGYSVIEGLGFAAAAPQTPVTIRAEIMMLFLSLLEQKFPETLSKTRITDEGPVYELSYETTAYTELIPRIMLGLRKLALAPGIEESICVKILNKFLNLWNDLVDYKIIWGSQNVVELAKHLTFIGLDKRTSTFNQNEIFNALMKRSTVLTVMEFLGSLLEVIEESKRIALIILELYKNLEERLLNDEFLESDEKFSILRIMLKLTKRKNIGETVKEAELIRESILNYVFEGIREGFYGLTTELKKLLTIDHFSEDLKDVIKKKLIRYKSV